MRSSPLVAFVLLSVSTLGCPADPPSSTEQAETCSIDFSIGGTRTAHTLEIGTFVDGAFVATADQGSIRTQIGGQGATMITPAFRLPAGVDDADELCLLVKLSHEPLDAPDDTEITPGAQVTIRFLRTASGYLSDGVVFDVMGDAGLPAFRMRFTASVIGADFEAAHTLSSVLVGGEIL